MSESLLDPIGERLLAENLTSGETERVTGMTRNFGELKVEVEAFGEDDELKGFAAWRVGKRAGSWMESEMFRHDDTKPLYQALCRLHTRMTGSR